MINKDQVTVIKLNPDREEAWRYQGRVIQRQPHSLLIEAFFNIDEVSFQGITLQRNDRAMERYYDNRWYNIFEIHDREDDHLKAWYCNVTRPAEFTPGRVAYVDLALDLLIYPNGDYLVLDEEEFEALDLTPETRQRARKGLHQLITLAKSGEIAKALK